MKSVTYEPTFVCGRPPYAVWASRALEYALVAKRMQHVFADTAVFNGVEMRRVTEQSLAWLRRRFTANRKRAQKFAEVLRQHGYGLRTEHTQRSMFVA